MVAKLFVNLPVKDLGISRDFFQNTGFEIADEFTNESSACIKFSESIYAMLFREESFEKFSGKKPVDISLGHEVINAIQLEESSEVDLIIEKAL